MRGRVHSIETFGTVDGPGIRVVIFLQGCGMRCKYCHNPDTWAVNAGKQIEAADLARDVLRYKSFIQTRGGVTVSGGEPLMQIDFVTELLTFFKKDGLHTAVDTSGFTFDKENPQALEKFGKLLDVCDLFLLDIKHIDDAEHKKLTGHSNKNTLDFAQYLSDNGKDMWIRHVLVPHITDKDEYLHALGDYIARLKTVRKIEVLPYHTMGVEKYEKLGLYYPLKNTVPPTGARVANAVKILEHIED